MDRSVRVQIELFNSFGAKLIALLRAYLDESGMHANPGVVVVGGAITTANSWEQFSANCQPFLKKHGLSFFGTSDFFGSHGDFDGWPWPKKEAFLKTFMDIINRPKKVIIAHGMRLSDFEAIRTEFPKIRITPYKYCLEKCLADISQWARSKRRIEPIAVLIESGNKTESQTVRIWREATDSEWLREKYKLASITVMPKQLPTGEYIYPFIVADIVSNSLYKHHKAVLDSISDTVKVENTLLPLLKPKEQFGYMDTPESMRRWFEIARENKEYLEQVGENI